VEKETGITLESSMLYLVDPCCIRHTGLLLIQMFDELWHWDRANQVCSGQLFKIIFLI
jgi:hypothetical protein